jgi:hypothetical protein
MSELNFSLPNSVPKVQPAQQRILRRLLRDLVAFTGTAITASKPRKAPQRKRERLLYRQAATYADGEIEKIVVELGPERVLAALDRVTQPQLPLAAAE